MSRFGPLDNPAPLTVFHNALPPTAGNEASYNYWPVHVAATQNVETLNNLVPLPGKQVALFLWVARASRVVTTGKGMRPNPIRPSIILDSGLEGRMEFSTIAKAMAATRIHSAYALGASMAECEAIGAEAGMTAADLIPYADAVAMRESLFVYDPDPGATPPYTNVPCKVCIDKVVMPNARFIDGPGEKWGIVLDYEAHDDRSQAETLDLVQHVADEWHARGMKVYLYTNPIDGTVFPSNGLGPGNLPEVIQAVDKIGLLVGARYSTPDVLTSFYEQMRIISGQPDRNIEPDPDKLSLTLAPSGDDRIAALQAFYVMRRLLTDWSRIRTAWVWPNLMPMGGDDDTQATRMLGAAFFGQGTPAPMVRRG